MASDSACIARSILRNNRVTQIVNAQVAPAENIFDEAFAEPSPGSPPWQRCLFRRHAAAQQRAQYESLVAAHARANNVPEALVHRVIVRESRYHPELVGRGGTIGLMQIKLATARGLGYTGDAPACAIPTPISPMASNISPAPGAPPTATTPAPCVTMPAAIITSPSASGWSGRNIPRRCWRAPAKGSDEAGESCGQPREAAAEQVRPK